MKRIKEATYDEISDFEKLVNPLIRFIRKYWKADVKPKNLDALLEDYKEYDGMGEKKYECEFDGLVDGTVGSHPFHVRMSTPNVAYNIKEQGYDALTTLVGSCVAYGMSVGERHALLSKNNDFLFENIKEFLEDASNGDRDKEFMQNRAKRLLELMKLKNL